jgi:3-deoxy-7-phosphoheptulonate synthase
MTGVVKSGPELPVHRSPRWWRPSSWRALTAAQQPDWPENEAVNRVLAEIAASPPLVVPAEIRRLQGSLASVAEGGAFLLQAGDCAERFSSGSEPELRRKLKVMTQMAALLTQARGVPVVTVGRIAGQLGKPRTDRTELVDGVELPVFRGEIINGPEPTTAARRADPERLRTAYHYASSTLNTLRMLTHRGFADPGQVRDWNRDFLRRGPENARYQEIADEIEFAGAPVEPEFYTSHEALLPAFEQALTRFDPVTESWFATSAHLVWVGERTRQLDGAHLEFVSGIANPVGIKLGPGTTPARLRALCERVDPERVPGRLVLIARLGARRVSDVLPRLVQAVAGTGHRPVWICDPMHANTFTAESGYKTRRFTDIEAEVSGFFRVHEELGTHAGGLHLELTGEEHVTECLGGPGNVVDAELGAHYETLCDPRLNADQAVDLAFRIASWTRYRVSAPVVPVRRFPGREAA